MSAHRRSWAGALSFSFIISSGCTGPEVLLGPSITIRPAFVDFGEVVLGRTAQARLTVENGGDRPLVGLTAGPGALWDEGLVASLAAAGLEPGQSTTVTVRFIPRALGDLQADLRVAAAGLRAPAIPIRARVIAAPTEPTDPIPAPFSFRCDPEGVDFGRVEPGECRSEAVVCQSSHDVEITGWAFALEREALSATPSAELGLRAGQSLNLEVTFCPAREGAVSDELRVAFVGPEQRAAAVAVRVSGRGGVPRLCGVPDELDLGFVGMLVPAPAMVQLESCGSAPLEVRARAEPSDWGEIELEHREQQTAPPQTTLSIPLSFAALAEGPVAADLVLATNDPEAPLVRVRVRGEGVRAQACSYELAPSASELGVLEVGRNRRSTLSLRNTGRDACVVRISGFTGEPTARLEDPDPRGRIVLAGAEQAFHLELFGAEPGRVSGTLALHVSHPARQRAEVPFSAEIIESAPLLAPSPVDWGPVPAGCRTIRRTVRLHGTLDVPLRVLGIELDEASDPAFRLIAPSPIGRELAPRGTLEVHLELDAAAAGARSGLLRVRGEAAGRPVLLTASLGAEVIAGGAEERFSTEPPREADVLFVLDDGTTPRHGVQALADHIAGFLDVARAFGTSYRIALTTTTVERSPAGRFVPVALPPGERVITEASPVSAEATFRLHAQVGTNGSATERGLEGAFLGLSGPLSLTENQGFSRRDASLSVVYVSDEEDYSSGSVSFYHDALQALRGSHRPALTRPSAIVGPAVFSDCHGAPEPTGHHDPGLRYLALVERSAGLAQPFCWLSTYASLSHLAGASLGAPRGFELRGDPRTDSLRVEVDGVRIERFQPGSAPVWRYEPEHRLLVFEEIHTPEVGADVRIQYEPRCP